jgi:hypothetical protein
MNMDGKKSSLRDSSEFLLELYHIVVVGDFEVVIWITTLDEG